MFLFETAPWLACESLIVVLEAVATAPLTVVMIAQAIVMPELLPASAPCFVVRNVLALAGAFGVHRTEWYMRQYAIVGWMYAKHYTMYAKHYTIAGLLVFNGNIDNTEAGFQYYKYYAVGLAARQDFAKHFFRIERALH